MTSASITTINWTEPASADFLDALEWLEARSPSAAERIGRLVLQAVEGLADHPHLGREGRSPDTRELVVVRTPYVVVYSIERDQGAPPPSRIVILRVLHGAMRWPPENALNE
jgi:toxin ParE1/3/4